MNVLINSEAAAEVYSTDDGKCSGTTTFIIIMMMMMMIMIIDKSTHCLAMHLKSLGHQITSHGLT